MTHIFDSFTLAKQFTNTRDEKIVLINSPENNKVGREFLKEYDKLLITGREVCVDGIYYDREIGESSEILPFRIFRYFTEFNCHDEYLVHTKLASQYEGVVSGERIKEA